MKKVYSLLLVFLLTIVSVSIAQFEFELQDSLFVLDGVKLQY